MELNENAQIDTSQVDDVGRSGGGGVGGWAPAVACPSRSAGGWLVGIVVLGRCSWSAA